MNLEAALQTFIVESRELLQSMEDSLLLLEREPDNADAINATFRAMHTIKGSAGLFGLDEIVRFTHVVESLLDRARNNDIRVDDTLTALMLECGDHIGHLVGKAAGDSRPIKLHWKHASWICSGGLGSSRRREFPISRKRRDGRSNKTRMCRGMAAAM